VILKALTVENFRQFFGQQTLTFSDHQDRNVTIVYGANGSGKTALLNAFTWALFKQTSPGFERPDDVVNHRALAEAEEGADIVARVVVVFEHENQEYTVERSAVQRIRAEGDLRVKEALSVTFVDEGGRTHNRTDHAEGTINQILPERLHRFFFFDGERIENLVKPDSYAEIEDAIKTILGLTVIERAIKHVDDARKVLEKEYSAVGSDEVKAIQTRLDAARGEKETKTEERRRALENRSANAAQLDNVNARLAELEDAADLQRKRSDLEEALAGIQTELAARRRSLSTRLSDSGFLAFAEGLVDHTASTYEDLRERGEIPTSIKLQFVEDLLERGACICGNPLHEGEVAYEKVAGWRQRAGRQDVEEAWMRLSANARAFKTRRKEFFDYVHETNRERAVLRDQEATTKDKLSAIKESIDELDSDEIQGLERRRDELKSAIDSDNLRLALAERDILELDRRIADLERELEVAGAAIAKARVAQRRVVVARESRDVFSSILNLRTEEVRRQIDSRVKQVYTQISFKPYVPSLDEAFHLDLRKTSGRDEDLSVAKSTGENQILSLAFVGAVAEHARDRYRESQAEGRTDGMLSFRGGIYPVVMDSPFGSLDENYQRQIADAIPRLAPQVIVFVSKSQGLHAVQDVLMPRVDREYVIEYATPKADQDRETIELRTGVHPYVEPVDGPYEWATVRPA
jgi:DNA sulfur modification protein DndD